MPAVRQIAHINSQVSTTSVTTYLAIGDVSISYSTTEANRQTTMRTAGVLANLYVRVTANTITASTTARSRLNGGNGSMSVSIGSSTTGEFEDTSNSDTIAVADVLNYQLVTGATGTSISISIWGSTFAATTNTVKKHIGSPATGFTTASVTNFIPMAGTGAQNGTTESQSQYTARIAGTLNNFYLHVSTNTRTTTTFGSRRNGGAGNLTVSVGASGTGIFEDTTHSDTVSAADTINFFITTGTGTNNIVWDVIAAEFTSTANQFICLTGGSTGNIISADIRYLAIGGNGIGETIETNAKATIRVALTARNLAIVMVTNTITAASTFVLRQNATDSALTISITASTTGLFEDTTHSVTIAATDELNYSLASGSTGSQIRAVLAAFTATVVTSTNYTQTLTETVTYTDTVLKTAGKMLSDTVTHTDSLVRQSSKVLSETVTHTASLLKQASRTLTETITHSDVVTAAKLAVKQLTETITQSDTFRAVISAKTLLETITYTDTVIRGAAKVLTETITHTASVIKQTARSLTETITHSDTVTTFRTAFITLTDTVTHTDSVLRTAGKVLTETITHTATIAIANFYGRVFTETVTFTDALLKRVGKVLTETLTLVSWIASWFPVSRSTDATYSQTTRSTDATYNQASRTSDDDWNLTNRESL